MTTKKIVSCIDIPSEIVKEVFCTVGMDWFSYKLFIGKLKGIDSEIAFAAAKKLGLSPQDLHSATCVFKKCEEKRKTRITGDSHVAEKVLKLKVRITIEECELI